MPKEELHNHVARRGGAALDARGAARARAAARDGAGGRLRPRGRGTQEPGAAVVAARGGGGERGRGRQLGDGWRGALARGFGGVAPRLAAYRSGLL